MMREHCDDADKHPQGEQERHGLGGSGKELAGRDDVKGVK